MTRSDEIDEKIKELEAMKRQKELALNGVRYDTAIRRAAIFFDKSSANLLVKYITELFDANECYTLQHIQIARKELDHILANGGTIMDWKRRWPKSNEGLGDIPDKINNDYEDESIGPILWWNKLPEYDQSIQIKRICKKRNFKDMSDIEWWESLPEQLKIDFICIRYYEKRLFFDVIMNMDENEEFEGDVLSEDEMNSAQDEIIKQFKKYEKKDLIR